MLIFAYGFIVLSVFISVFQLSLSLGAPWGEFTMGGKFPGKLPKVMRIAALGQILVLLLFSVMVASKAGMAFESFHRVASVGIWFVLAFFVFGSIVNLTSPSKKEKLVMGPLNVMMLVSVFLVAIGL